MNVSQRYHHCSIDWVAVCFVFISQNFCIWEKVMKMKGIVSETYPAIRSARLSTKIMSVVEWEMGCVLREFMISSPLSIPVPLPTCPFPSTFGMGM
mmetsp:Transcript_12058/g.19645  ORF Transcript_12058/g.19645 Transcript_12058/m.19645 type:complete len:96 (+) Transcript_12058:261-548(+)